MSRIDLGEGRWAEVHDVILQEHAVAMEGAYFRGSRSIDDGVFPVSFKNEVLMAMVGSWSFGEVSPEVIAKVPAHVIDVLFEACEKAYVEGRKIPQA